MNFGPLSDEQRPDAAAIALPGRAAPIWTARRPPIGTDPRCRGGARTLGLVTFAPDDIDWDDEVRVFARGAHAASRPTR